MRDFLIFSCIIGAGVWYVETRPGPPPPPKKGEMVIVSAADGSLAARWQNANPARTASPVPPARP